MVRFIDKLPRNLLLLIGLLVLIVFSISLYQLTGQVDNAMFYAQWEEKVRTVNLFCDEIDQYVHNDDDWTEFDYAALMRGQVQDMDAWPSLFAALYDDELNLLTERISVTGEPLLHPLTDPDIRKIVEDNKERQEISATYKGLDNNGEDIQVYFRWVPSGKGYEHKLVFMIAMRIVPLSSAPSAILIRWCVLLIALTGVINVVAGIAYASIKQRR